MKPFSIVLTINLTLFAVIGLFFVFVANRPELIPLFTSIPAAFNFLGIGGFYVDRKKDIMWAFVWGALLTTVVSVVGFFVMREYKDLVPIEEGYTSMLNLLLPKA